MHIYTQGDSASGMTTTISILSGETVALAMTLSSGGSPIDLTGYSLKSQINFPTPLTLNTTNSGITITNAANGVISLNISSAQSSVVEQGAYDFDLWMTSPTDVETPLLTGKFLITPNIVAVP
ncbi:MAG: hypothetical protein SFT92_02295 [Rickettsiales bacterium]|nr:hypothetical protein [Rickettsiales bacterium]